MARTDAIVLGAGIVGTSIALHLAKRGRRSRWWIAAGRARRPPTATPASSKAIRCLPHAFPEGFGALLRIALKQAPEANYHLAALANVAPWLLAYRANSGSRGASSSPRRCGRSSRAPSPSTRR